MKGTLHANTRPFGTLPGHDQNSLRRVRQMRVRGLKSVGVIIAAGLLAAACGTSSGGGSGSGGSGSSSASGTLTIDNESGGNWTCDFNPFNLSDVWLSLGPVYESLVFVNALQNAKEVPWL